MEYPKVKRVVDKELINTIMEEQGSCLVGYITDKYGACSDRGYDPHHIDSRGSGGADARGNIIRLCRYHHNLFHNGLIPKTELRGILTTFYNNPAIWTTNRTSG
jgi:hypothetical protein